MVQGGALGIALQIKVTYVDRDVHKYPAVAVTIHVCSVDRGDTARAVSISSEPPPPPFRGIPLSDLPWKQKQHKTQLKK